jgi:uncharacterized protein (TIGR03435 family)
MKKFTLLSLFLATQSFVVAQSSAERGALAFDVVSVKLNKTGDGRHRWGRQPGGRWLLVNSPIATLIRVAYPTKLDDLIGAPEWVTSDAYDIEARATFEPTVEQERAMLRALLADRFKLAVHYEAQDRPIYHLVVAREDGRLGRQIRRIEIDCATYRPQGDERDEARRASAEPPPCAYRMSARATVSLVSGGRSMQSLADTISGMAGRPIFDKTGLQGYYAFTLDSFGGNDGVSIFTALQEQLGLKLVSARGRIDVLVVDRIERPTEN